MAVRGEVAREAAAWRDRRVHVLSLVSMMVKVLSEHTPKEIADADIYFIDKIGLRNHLSPTRSNGLLSMLKQMKMYGVAYQSSTLQ